MKCKKYGALLEADPRIELCAGNKIVRKVPIYFRRSSSGGFKQKKISNPKKSYYYGKFF